MCAGFANSSIEPIAIRAGSLSMTIDPALGARILSCSLDGQNILLDARAVAGTENANNFGGTFWPSPQSAWGWPPIAEIDNGPYAVVERSAHRVTLSSSVGSLASGASITLTKTIVATPEKDSIDVTYVMTNVGNRAIQLAGWQILRVPAGGLTFFRLGEGGLGDDKLATQTLDGVQWYAYDANVVVAQGQKTFADATGWVAHVDGDRILVNAFADVAKDAAAPGEAEVELYADPSHTYVEIEPQSCLQTLEPAVSGAPWTVRFWLRRLPVGLEARVGNAALVAFVEDLIRAT